MPFFHIHTLNEVFNMRHNKLKKIISLLLAAAMMICIFPLGASAAEKGETVRVGASPDFGIYKSGSEYGGYAYDYLLEMQKYTGHKYTFVEADPQELVEMLSEGLIDVIPCFSAEEFAKYADHYDAVRARSMNAVQPELTTISLMKKFTAIYTSDNNPDSISYFNTEELNKSTIGYLAASKTKYFADGTFIRGDIDRANFVEYDTEEQMRSDFNSGKIDAVVKECFRSWRDETIVYQYNTTDCYFMISGEDQQLAYQLDTALNTVNMADSDFSSTIYHKYIEKYGPNKYAYSSAEKAYIKYNPVLRVAYNTQCSILEKYNGNTGNILGYTGSVIDSIEQFSGLDIEVTPCQSLEECVKLLESGSVDAICGGVNDSSMAMYGKFAVSSPYDSTPIILAAKINHNIGSTHKIAIPYTQDDVAKHLSVNHTDATPLIYADIRECMNAVEKGEADAICAGSYETVYLINNGYENIEVINISNDLHTECFAISNDAPDELISIIGKCISRFSGAATEISRYKSLATANELSDTVSTTVVYLCFVLLGLVVIAALIFVLISLVRSRKANELDPLTGGRNRTKFVEDTKKLIKKTNADKWALVLFDINKFKYVNDRLGYDEGDRMLERIYKTLSDNMESNEVFARLSDDNFACIIRNGSDTDISARMDNIFAEFDRRNSLFVKYPIIFSAGVCRIGQCRDMGNDIDINTALDRCTIAKRTLKGQHYSSIAFYDGKIREKALREKDYESVMPTALAQHEFECYLQPKYGLKSRHIEGAEALIRWNSKEFGFVYPNDFIPLSEKNGFVVELDFFILEEVCKSMRRWLNDGKAPVVVSVNQSRLHLNYDDYIWRLREIVDKYEIPYEYIELELTESLFTENTDKLLTIMHKLHEIGFKLSLDDFGSGYSSLNMLKDIPVDVVKIDREFFNGTVNSEKGRAVISTVVDLAKNLNMEVISEGVETLEQVEFLTEINCAMVQGYYFAKPMPIAAFEELWHLDTNARLITSEQ